MDLHSPCTYGDTGRSWQNFGICFRYIVSSVERVGVSFLKGVVCGRLYSVDNQTKGERGCRGMPGPCGHPVNNPAPRHCSGMSSERLVIEAEVGN